MRRAQSKVICRLLLTHLPYLLDSSWYLQHDTWGHNVRTVGRLWGPCSPLPLSRWCGGHRSHLRNRLPAIAPQRITFTSPSSLLPRPISVVRTSNGCGGVFCIRLSCLGGISSTWRRGQKEEAGEYKGSSHTRKGWSERQWLLWFARWI